MAGATSRKHKKSNKGRKKLMKTKRLERANDQIIEDLKSKSASFIINKLEEEGFSEKDHEYCLICSKYFTSKERLEIHKRTKGHKKKIKILQHKPYSDEEAKKAAGFGSYTVDFFNPVHLDALKDHMSDPGCVIGKKRKIKKNKEPALLDSIQKLSI